MSDLDILNQLTEDELVDLVAEELEAAEGVAAPEPGLPINSKAAFDAMSPENRAKFDAEEARKKLLDGELAKSDHYSNPMVSGSAQLMENVADLTGGIVGGAAGVAAGGAVASVPGAIVGGGVGGAAGSDLARYGADQALQATGMRPDESVLDGATSRAYKFEDGRRVKAFDSEEIGGEDFKNEAIWGTVLPGAIKAIGGARKMYRAIFPNMNLTKYYDDVKEGAAAAYLGGAGKTSGREAQLTREAKALEDAFLEANPMRGINPEDPEAIKRLMSNMDNIKNDAKWEKLEKLREADAALPPEKQNINFDVYKQKFENANTHKVLDDEITQVVREQVDNSSLAGQFYERNGKQIPLRKTGLNGEDTVQLIQNLDDKIEALAGYDDLKLATQSTDPSFFAKNQELQALKEARSYADKKLLERVPDLEPVNTRISAMIEYKKIAERRTLDLLQDLSPKTGKSLVKNIDNSKGSWVDAATGGQISKINTNRGRAEDALKMAEDITNLQGVTDRRAAGMPSLGAAEQGIISASQAAGGAPGIAAAAKLPRVAEEWAGLAMDEAQAAQFDPNILMQAQTAFASGTPEEAKRGVAMLAAQRPDMFAPSEVPGMNSMIDGVIYDELEKQAAQQKLDSIFQNDTTKRLRAKEAILDGKPLEPYAVEALGGQPQREQSFEDQFITQEEGGQKLDAYYPKVKGSGVTVGTGVDLGSRTADELRGLDIPEDLVVKLSPYLGKKDERAVQMLRHNPLQLTPEEATLLDQKVKGQIKQQVAGTFKEANGLDIEALPEEARTVVYSLAYNFGANLEKKLPTAWKAIVDGNWEGLQNFLRKTKWKQPELTDRRRREAALLEPLIPRTPGEPTFSLKDTQLASLVADDEPVV